MISEPRITRRMIALIVCREFEVSLETLMGPLHHREYTRARFAVWHLVKKFRPETSQPQLGAMLRKDHTTARHGLLRAEEMLASDVDFAERVNAACEKVSQWRGNPVQAAEVIFRRPDIANEVETPPAASPVVLCVEPARPRPGTVGYSDLLQSNWWKKNDERFRAAMTAAYPETVRVPMNEAAE